MLYCVTEYESSNCSPKDPATEDFGVQLLDSYPVEHNRQGHIVFYPLPVHPLFEAQPTIEKRDYLHNIHILNIFSINQKFPHLRTKDKIVNKNSAIPEQKPIYKKSINNHMHIKIVFDKRKSQLSQQPKTLKKISRRAVEPTTKNPKKNSVHHLRKTSPETVNTLFIFIQQQSQYTAANTNQNPNCSSFSYTQTIHQKQNHSQIIIKHNQTNIHQTQTFVHHFPNQTNPSEI